MNEILIFTLNAIAMYFVADWIVRMIETRRGEVLKQRQAIFFVIILVLLLVSFQVLKSLSISGLMRPQLPVQARIETGEMFAEPV